MWILITDSTNADLIIKTQHVENGHNIVANFQAGHYLFSQNTHDSFSHSQQNHILFNGNNISDSP